MRAEAITPRTVWQEYERMLEYNASIGLDETVRTNENFFIGKQWEGVRSNGLPTPVFNILKRVTLFTVASITSDRLTMRAAPVDGAGTAFLSRAASAVTNEFAALFEQNKLGALLREMMRNAAVDGDAATFSWWDADADAGFGAKGAIVTELIQNTRIGFGNEADRQVQSQPYILIKRRELTEELRRRAKALGCKQWAEITEDSDEQDMDGYKQGTGKTTVLLRLWKDWETGNVHACETTRGIMIRKPWDLGLRLYPVTWLSWDTIQDSYHGQAMLTGLIPNQVFINKLFAMSMISLMTTAYPKVIYDRTRISGWDNGIGRAVGVNGGGVEGAAKLLGPAAISPQIAQFIELAAEMTRANLGATRVALGEARPDNTSAIIALQRASATPNELTRQSLYQCVEELGRIYMDFMASHYGERLVEADLPDSRLLPPEALDFALSELERTESGKLLVRFNFAALREIPMRLKLDVGASAYWSEVASAQTLDNLLTQGQIDVVDYLERIPGDYISDKQGLIEAIKAKRAQPAAE